MRRAAPTPAAYLRLAHHLRECAAKIEALAEASTPTDKRRRTMAVRSAQHAAQAISRRISRSQPI